MSLFKWLSLSLSDTPDSIHPELACENKKNHHAVQYVPKNNVSCKGAYRNDDMACENKFLTIGNIFFGGLMQKFAPGGPPCLEIGLPAGTIPSTRAAASYFTDIYGEPSLVVLKNLFWDVSIMSSNTRPNIKNGVALLHRELSKYRAALEEAIEALQVIFPRSVLALRTDPKWTDKNRFSDQKKVPREGMDKTSLALNNLMRMVADDKKLLMFDFYRMFEAMRPQDYLWDDIHITHHYSLTEVHVMLLTLLTFEYPGFVNIADIFPPPPSPPPLEPVAPAPAPVPAPAPPVPAPAPTQAEP